MTVLRPLAACALLLLAGLAAAADDPPQQERQKTVEEQDDELYQDMMKSGSPKEENPDQVRPKRTAAQETAVGEAVKTSPPPKPVQKPAAAGPAPAWSKGPGAPGGGGGGEEAPPPASVEEAAAGAATKSAGTAKKAQRMADTLKKSLATAPEGMPGAGGPQGAELKPSAGSGPADPKTPQDLALASMSGFSGAFTALGLHAGRGPSGESAILRADGRLASPEEVEALKDRIAKEPAALLRRPDFFAVLPREKFQALKDAYRDKPALRETAFKHIEMSAAQRDFMRSASCDPLAGGCNPAATKTAYRKGDFVPPEDLKAIHKTVAPEEDEGEEGVAASTATPKGAVYDASKIDGIYAKLNGLIGAIQDTMGVKFGESGGSETAADGAGAGSAESGWSGGGGSGGTPIAFSQAGRIRVSGSAPPPGAAAAASGAPSSPRPRARRVISRRALLLVPGAGAALLLLLAALWSRRKPRSRFAPLEER